MKATDDDLREALGHERRRVGAGREGCPSAEAIVMHAEGAEEAVDRRSRDVLDHVARCEPCAVEYRLASTLKPWADGAAAALRAPTAAKAPVRTQRLRAAWWPPALAASLLLVGLGGWNLALRRQGFDVQAKLAEARGRDADAARRLAEMDAELAAVKRHRDAVGAPAMNVPIVDLDAGAVRGARGAEALLRIPAGTAWATFVLTVSGGASPQPHSLEIRSADGRAVWHGDGLVANPFGTFTVAVPAALIPAGHYDFVLSRPARGGATTRVVQMYRVVVRPSAP